MRCVFSSARSTSPKPKLTGGLQKKDLAYHLTEHLRLNGVYWGLTALSIMGHKDALPRDAMVDYVMSCWDDEAGECSLGSGWAVSSTNS